MGIRMCGDEMTGGDRGRRNREGRGVSWSYIIIWKVLEISTIILIKI